jgi:hypothetical protein
VSTKIRGYSAAEAVMHVKIRMRERICFMGFSGLFFVSSGIGV